MTAQVMPRQLINELRLLRDAGYIRGFIAYGERCTVLLEDGVVSGQEDDVRQLVARIKLWTLVHDAGQGTLVRRSALLDDAQMV